MIKKNKLVGVVSFVFAASFFLSNDVFPQKSKAQRPNIILIMADDLGYSDIGSYVGKSLVPVLTGITSEVDRNEPIFWERAGNRAVRKGKWKLVSDFAKNKWELYDLEKDRGETTDVASENLVVVRELAADYQQWASRTGVVDFETIKPQNPIRPGVEKKKTGDLN